MNTSPQALAPPPAALSESAVLRALNLATSRREWLRRQLPCRPIGGALVYSQAAVEALAARMATRPNRAIINSYAPIALSHR